MGNTVLTIDMVTREALRIAHEKCQFIGTTDRQYDDSYAKTGAKIGSALRVRKPNMYTRTTGSRIMDVQDQSEVNGTITVATQDHVDMRFNSAELALSIDDLSKRYIEPAVATLVSGIEADFIAYCTKAVYQLVGTAGIRAAALRAAESALEKMARLARAKELASRRRTIMLGVGTALLALMLLVTAFYLLFSNFLYSIIVSN